MKKTIRYDEYLDSVQAGWLGKSIGGVIGAPYENHKCWHNVLADNLWPDVLYPNDDLDIQVVWLELLQERGVFLEHKDLVDYWQDRCHYNFCEYGHFLHNAQRAIMPPMSGFWNNEFFRESEGCPIRAEVWGYACPGSPQLAADYATLDAELDHWGASVRIERFLAAANAAACVTNDLEEALAAGLTVIPKDCPEALAIEEVRKICQETPDPKQCWRRIIRKYGDKDASKAITNHAIVLMALFLGEGDFVKTMHLCVCAGWDTDCTAATAGALLGALGGVDSLPKEYLDKLGPNLVCNIEVKHKEDPIAKFADETCRLGVEIAALRGGIEITDAPAVELRPAPSASVKLSPLYAGQGPVLFAEKSTEVTIQINNQTDAAVSGTLNIKPAENTVAEYDQEAIVVASGETKQVAVKVKRVDPALPLPDKNLFQVTFGKSELVFGLGGARQWMVYGPYWNMWDHKENEICPYFNDEKTCLPGQAGLGGDNYNHYVYLDYPYLDEDTLLKEEIAEEVPFAIECGEDIITERDLGGFNGAACYYFTRSFKAPEKMDGIGLFFGRTSPVKVWVDGNVVYERNTPRCWSTRDERVGIPVTGEQQRMVVKFARQAEAGSFSVKFMRPYTGERKRGIADMADFMSDFPTV